MGLWVDLAQAYRRADAPPNAVQPEEAAAAGFDVRPAVANILSRCERAHLWRVLFQALRPEAVRYLAAAALLVAVTPLVPVALRSATGALERGNRRRPALRCWSGSPSSQTPRCVGFAPGGSVESSSSSSCVHNGFCSGGWPMWTKPG